MNRPAEEASQIARNVALHDRVARKYERLHGEIFNDVEQARLRGALQRAVDEVRTGSAPVRALDMGCGSGNLTGHLLEIGAEVTAADVSSGFLKLVEDRYSGRPLRTHLLSGRDMSELGDGSFELVATYSVLHHIPDYLGACREMARMCRAGGVIFIDHEASPNSWSDPRLEQFRREASRFDWRKYARPSNYAHRVRRMFNPKHSNEGDIHVWPDDHIEWDAIEQAMADAGCDTVVADDYLLYRSLYRREVYDRHKDRLADTRVMMFRKRGGQIASCAA